MLIFEGRNRVTSGYKLPDRPSHKGLDIVGDDSRDVRTPVAGFVKSSTMITNKSDPTWEWGNYVRVDDANGNRLFFCHMASRSVKVGDYVKPGDKLGVMGNTGYSFGAHTHFEVRKPDGRTNLNPAEYLGIKNAKGTYTEGMSLKLNGWVKSNSKWYFYENGEKVKDKWIQDAGWWYRVGPDGSMKTGYITVGAEVFFLNTSRITVGNITIPTGACIITDSRGNIKGA